MLDHPDDPRRRRPKSVTPTEARGAPFEPTLRVLRHTRWQGDALNGFDMATFTEQHPTVVAAVTDYFRPGRTVDDLFRECLEVVIEGATARAGPPSPSGS